MEDFAPDSQIHEHSLTFHAPQDAVKCELCPHFYMNGFGYWAI